MTSEDYDLLAKVNEAYWYEPAKCGDIASLLISKMVERDAATYSIQLIKKLVEKRLREENDKQTPIQS